METEQQTITFETLNSGHLWTLAEAERYFRQPALQRGNGHRALAEKKKAVPALTREQLLEAFYVLSDGETAHAALMTSKMEFDSRVFKSAASFPLSEFPALLAQWQKVIQEGLNPAPARKKTPLEQLEEVPAARTKGRCQARRIRALSSTADDENADVIAPNCRFYLLRIWRNYSGRSGGATIPNNSPCLSLPVPASRPLKSAYA